MDNHTNISDIVGTSEQVSINNNYKFDAMLRAIDFFSQRFSLDMLIDFAYDFVNEILTLKSSALFLYKQDQNAFALEKSRLYDKTLKSIANSSKLQDIAKYYGTIITRNFTLFFSDDFIDEFKPQMLIPLINSNKLIGFIITEGKVFGELDDDDFEMGKAMMHLFNDSFERNQVHVDLEEKEKRLDNKIFELYTINKASKTMFSEIDLDKLLTQSVEIFSEISGSLITGFGVRDLNSKSLVLKAFSNVKAGSTQCPEGFALEFVEDNSFDGDKYIFNVADDTEHLKRLFTNSEKLNEIDAEYVVLIVKEKILGFATLSNTKLGEEYAPETLELIGSIAISSYIALNNAMIFREISEAKADIEEKYAKLLKMANN